MWIKICGITSSEDAELAVAAGADAVGFVFAESPRRVNVDAVREITARLSRRVETIGVFVDSTLDDVLSAIHNAGLTGVQLLGEYRGGFVQELRARTDKNSRPLHIVRVLHYGADAESFEIALRATCANKLIETILVDTRVGDKQGGTGVPFDWLAARNSFLMHAPHVRLIAAGGLTPENVRVAIHTLRPWGVDVSSGVETVPGRKDRGRVAEFIRAARAATRELDREKVGIERVKC
jgi:phosphoribosylanthranilate isomerase